MRNLLLRFGTGWAGFGIVMAVIILLTGGDKGSVVLWLVVGVVIGSLLSLPYFFRPPDYVRETVWFFPIQFLPIQWVLRFISWVGWVAIRGVWFLLDLVVSRRNAADVIGDQQAAGGHN